MKKILLILAMLISFACEKPPVEPTNPNPGSGSGSTPPPISIPLPESGKYGLFLNGELRGANMYQQQNGSEAGQVWNPNITLQDLKNLKSAGANFVNYSVPGPYDVNTYNLRTDFASKLDTLVGYASDAGLYIILAFRTGPGRGEYDITEDGINNKKVYTDTIAQNAYTEMWKKVATKYKGNKYIAGYDLMVEPHDVATTAWATFAQKLVNAIRAIDNDVPIIVPTPDWSTVNGLKMMTKLSGDKLVYAVHQYEPYTYSHNNSGTATDAISRLDGLYSSITTWANNNNAPIIVNEFGAANKVTGGEKFIAAQLLKLDGNKISHAAWIWEVEYDPDYTYAEFDFKDKAVLLNEYKKSWLKNKYWP